MIEKNVEKHWKEMFQIFYKEEDFVTDKSWPPNCNDANEKSDKAGSENRYNPNINYDPSMKNFEILLRWKTIKARFMFATLTNSSKQSKLETLHLTNYLPDQSQIQIIQAQRQFP
jgi:hypothetical protein